MLLIIEDRAFNVSSGQQYKVELNILPLLATRLEEKHYASERYHCTHCENA